MAGKKGQQWSQEAKERVVKRHREETGALRQRVVKLVIEQGLSGARAGESVGLAPTTVNKWLREAGWHQPRRGKRQRVKEERDV